MRLLYSLLLILGVTTALADPSLSVSFVNTTQNSSQCQFIPSSIYPQQSFNVVIQNLHSAPVTIKTVTFNGYSDGTQTGSPYIKAGSDIPLEQQYFLLSCNGKQLAANGSPGDTCSIPLTLSYPSDPTQIKATLNVTAISDVNPAPASTSASFTVDNTVSSAAKLTLYNVSDRNYQYSRSQPHPNPITNNSLVLLFFDVNNRGIGPAVFTYTIQNTSTVAKTFTTFCNYQLNPDPNFSRPLSPPANITNNSCANMTLAAGASCGGSISMNPAGYYASSALLNFTVTESGAPVSALNGPHVYANYLFNGWNDP